MFKDTSHLPLADQLLITACRAAGIMESTGDYTLALDRDTDWLQAAYEEGRSAGLAQR